MIELIEKIKSDLGKTFKTVRVTSVQTSEQFILESKAVNPEKMPAVFIVFDSGNYTQNCLCEYHFSLVIIGKFSAGSEEKALRIFHSLDELFKIFPVDGKRIGDFFIFPEDCIASSPDSMFNAVAVGFVCKKGF